MAANKHHGLTPGTAEQLSPAEKVEADRQVILSWAAHFLERGADETARYCAHIGITPADLEGADDNIGTAFLRHYTTADGYDVGRAGQDLASYSPMAARLRELQREDENRKEHHAAQERAGAKRRKARNGTAKAQSVN
jgi:hypothetical protein